MEPVTVAEAIQIVLGQARSFGTEMVPLDGTVGRVLAQPIVADRDLPPHNRVTMDGIAIFFAAYAAGQRTFAIEATMAAGQEPLHLAQPQNCIEVMTGCALPPGTDTVIRYEDIEKTNGTATILAPTVKPGGNVHQRGADTTACTVVVAAGTLVTAAVISMAASVGQHQLWVHRLPKIAVVSTGNELVDVHETPEPWQIRRSNVHAIRAMLQANGADCTLLHLPDDMDAATAGLQQCIAKHDAVILSGGVSMGLFDYVPAALQSSGVTQLFHKVLQRPGKPFWFGVQQQTGTVVFAFPGNPVSAFMCAHRYFVPWLQACTHGKPKPQAMAILTEPVTFQPSLQYFLQVQVSVSATGQLVATPLVGNGSGDFSNLLQVNAFMELPQHITHFAAGEVYPIWPFQSIV
jgi:molybdopterin molybdotransferase